TAVPLMLITVLPAGLGLAPVLAVTTLMFVTTSGRWVPGMALITNSSEPRVRGSFMSLNSAVQQMGAGLASWARGLLLRHREGGGLTGYPLVGLLACAAALASVYLAGRLRPAPGGASAPDADAQGESGSGPEVPTEAEAAAIATHFDGYRAAPGAVSDRGGLR